MNNSNISNYKKEMKEYNRWNNLKINTNTKKKILSFREREVYFMIMGKNIGFEENGKGGIFLRPIIILKKYNNLLFTGVPLTSTIKDNEFHYIFEFKNKMSGAILSQIRTYDVKRLDKKIGSIKDDDFKELKNKLGLLLKII